MNTDIITAYCCIKLLTHKYSSCNSFDKLSKVSIKGEKLRKM